MHGWGGGCSDRAVTIQALKGIKGWSYGSLDVYNSHEDNNGLSLSEGPAEGGSQSSNHIVTLLTSSNWSPAKAPTGWLHLEASAWELANAIPISYGLTFLYNIGRSELHSVGTESWYLLVFCVSLTRCRYLDILQCIVHLPISWFHAWECDNLEKFWELWIPYLKVKHYAYQETNESKLKPGDTKTKTTYVLSNILQTTNREMFTVGCWRFWEVCTHLHSAAGAGESVFVLCVIGYFHKNGVSTICCLWVMMGPSTDAK